MKFMRGLADIADAPRFTSAFPHFLRWHFDDITALMTMMTVSIFAWLIDADKIDIYILVPVCFSRLSAAMLIISYASEIFTPTPLSATLMMTLQISLRIYTGAVAPSFIHKR